MAKWMPSRARPSAGRSRGAREPAQITTPSKSEGSWATGTAAGAAGAGADHDAVEIGAQLVDGDVAPDVDPAADVDALAAELLDAALDDPLLDLELRHAEAHEPAGGLVALEQHHSMAGSAQLLGGGH